MSYLLSQMSYLLSQMFVFQINIGWYPSTIVVFYFHHCEDYKKYNTNNIGIYPCISKYLKIQKNNSSFITIFFFFYKKIFLEDLRSISGVFIFKLFLFFFFFKL